MSHKILVRHHLLQALICYFLVSCASPDLYEEYSYRIEISESSRIRFEGKGAAAGVMMSSSMGPMGIAIGVAIDEGIAKEIRGALDNADCAVEEVVSSSFQAVSREHGVHPVPLAHLAAGKPDVHIQVNQVKFRVVPSEQDLTMAEISLTIEKAGHMHQLASTWVEDASDGVPLEEVRMDGDKACRLLQAEATQLFDAWFKQQQK